MKEETLDLRDVVVVRTTGEKEIQFEVVGLIEDQERDERYAVLYSEAEDQFVVSDLHGDLLQDETLAQEVLDDFFDLAEEPAEGGDA